MLKEPEQIGLAVVIWVEHPPVGEERVVEVHEEFVEFLREESIPFDTR